MSSLSLFIHVYHIAYQLGIKIFLCIPLYIIGTPILAIRLLFVVKNASSLPGWLKWFDNADGDWLIGDLNNQKKE